LAAHHAAVFNTARARTLCARPALAAAWGAGLWRTWRTGDFGDLDAGPRRLGRRTAGAAERSQPGRAAEWELVARMAAGRKRCDGDGMGAGRVRAWFQRARRRRAGRGRVARAPPAGRPAGPGRVLDVASRLGTIQPRARVVDVCGMACCTSSTARRATRPGGRGDLGGVAVAQHLGRLHADRARTPLPPRYAE
jgi:hypothetical protein